MYWLFISYALAILFHDTWFYWLHRFLHIPGIYKHVHNVHHLSVNPSPWTSFSFHFFEAIGEGLVIIPLAFIIPLHLYTLIVFGFSIFAINVYGHLGYEIAPKWFRQSFLFELINTSVHHNLHHSKFNGNYGLYFRIWDRLMGTENKDYVVEFDKIQERGHFNQYQKLNLNNKA
jgi:sterol desaturase/sphingolipid hydroxylase (fatty acid hydroxylase superfamily)